MSQTIDVTGLSDEAILTVQRVVDAYRELARTPPPAAASAPTAEGPKPYWTGPIPTQDSPDWVNWFRAWCASRPKREGPVEIDDDRGSIYDRETP